MKNVQNAEKKIKSKRKTIRVYFKSVALLLSSQSIILRASCSFCRFLGIRRKQLIGKSVHAIFSGFKLDRKEVIVAQGAIYYWGKNINLSKNKKRGAFIFNITFSLDPNAIKNNQPDRLLAWVLEQGDAALGVLDQNFNYIFASPCYLSLMQDMQAKGLDLPYEHFRNQQLLDSASYHHAFNAILDSWECRFWPTMAGPGILNRILFKQKKATAAPLLVQQPWGEDASAGLHQRDALMALLKRPDPATPKLGLLMFDLTDLKKLNAQIGFSGGDKIIEMTAAAIKELLPTGLAGRLGGGTFLLAVPNAGRAELTALKDKTEQTFHKSADLDYSLAIGLALRQDGEKTLVQLLLDAEKNLEKHKLLMGKGKESLVFDAVLKTLTDKYHDELVHSRRVSDYCQKFGEALGLSADETKELTIAGYYHDIGKISVPDVILDKPGTLTADEWQVMKTHPEVGFSILKQADPDLARYVLAHHERWDGFGYPQGLKGHDIPWISRRIAIADAFEAMTSDRVYRSSISLTAAATVILRCAGSQFDPDFAKIFVTKVLNVGWN